MRYTRVRCEFRDHLLRYATTDSDVPAAELIFGELLANVVRHACGTGSLHLNWRDVRPTLLAADRGPGFCEPHHGALADSAAEHGRGLTLIRMFAVEMLIGNRAGGGACVSVILPVQRAHAKA